MSCKLNQLIQYLASLSVVCVPFQECFPQSWLLQRRTKIISTSNAITVCSWVWMENSLFVWTLAEIISLYLIFSFCDCIRSKELILLTHWLSYNIMSRDTKPALNYLHLRKHLWKTRLGMWSDPLHKFLVSLGLFWCPLMVWLFWGGLFPIYKWNQHSDILTDQMTWKTEFPFQRGLSIFDSNQIFLACRHQCSS